MDTNTFVIYLHELRNQCLYTQAAFQVFNRSLEQNSQTGALFAAQAALTSASQVAQILWPSRARARRRAEVMREKLKLPETHPLADRRFVELWDHADEKLDDFVKKTKGDRVLFDFVGPAKSVQIPGLTDEGVYRMYDTEKRVFVFRGIGYNLENLAKAVMEIGRRAEMLHNQLMPPQRPSGQPATARPAAAAGTETAEEVAPADTAPASAEDLPSPLAEGTAPAAAEEKA